MRKRRERESLLSRFARAAVASLCVLLGATGTSATPEIPETAVAAAVLTPSVLLDDPANVYLFPQLAPTVVSALRAFGASGGSAGGSGVVLRAGPHAFHYLHHEWDTPQGRWPYLQLYGAGWGVHLGRLRVGLSYSWASEARERGRTDRQIYPDGAQRGLSTETSFGTIDYRRGAIGVGWAQGRTSVDLVFGLADEQLGSNASSRDENVYELNLWTRTGISELRIESERHLDVALRFQLPVGRKALLRGFASFQEVADSVAGNWSTTTSHNESVHNHEEGRLDDSVSGQSWSCGVLFTAPAPHSCRWAVHGFYRNDRGPTQYWAGASPLIFDSLDRVQSREDAGELGLSLEAPVWWRLRLLVGAIVRASRKTEVHERVEYELLRRSESETEESLSHAFAWGLARDFDFLELTASVRKTLDPADPFALLDIGIRF